jgi:hypothetical protein
MGGDDSQKLRPRRRLSFLSGAQQTFRRIANSILYIKGWCRRLRELGSPPSSMPINMGHSSYGSTHFAGRWLICSR